MFLQECPAMTGVSQHKRSKTKGDSIGAVFISIYASDRVGTLETLRYIIMKRHFLPPLRALKSISITMSVIVMLGMIFCPAHATATDLQRKHILLLNSYHHTFSWNEEIFSGLMDVLRPKETGITLHVENMDTKRVTFSEQYIQHLHDVYLHKFNGMTIDLIMVTDNNALEFMRRFHDELFPNVPVVFCGINFFRDELIKGQPLFTGVAENMDAKGTLWWALNLHPETEHVYVINDSTPSGLSISRNIRLALKDFVAGIEVLYAKGKDLREIVQEVQALPKNSIVLYGVYYRDKSGRFHEAPEAIETISEAATVPVYGLLDFDLGHGIVGGMLTSGYSQGQSMAQIALHVLAGRHPQDIPVIKQSLSSLMFDYQQLKHYNINLDMLPEDSVIINQPRSFYAENTKLIWAGAAFTTIQMVIILVLMANTARRKYAEKELRKAHQLLEERVRSRTSEAKESVEAMRTVFDSSHDAIFIHDVGGHILDVNARMLKMYRITRDEISDLSIARDMSSRDNAVYRLSAIWRAVINGEPQYFEWKGRRPHDGSEFDAEVYLNRIVFRGQEAILANVRDISVRKESENRIRQSLSKFEAILENSLVGIAMSRGRKFVTINRRGAEIFGYAPGDLIGNDISFLLDDQNAVEEFIQESRDALQARGEFNTEQAFRDKNGNAIWCRMYAKAMAPESLGRGIIWAWDDISEHRRAQEDLMRTREDAEAANRAKSEFLAAMSHEIRTPMNAIVGMTEITLQTELNDAQRDYLHTVMNSARHLLSIINDILDLSKIEARKLTLDRTDFDLPYHVRTTIKGLEIQGREKELKVILDIAEDVPTCVKGDPLSLRQVLMNLVGNAIKFTHRGIISIRVSKAAPDPHRTASDARTIGLLFEVEDTGIGIPEEFMDTIFQSFSQTTRAFGGTGLGLAICKQLIGLMGGDICVESKVGNGSTFAFTAWYEPGFACPTPDTGLPKAAMSSTGGVHVLVAEDNDVNVMVTSLRLEEMGYTYSVASNGLEVLELLKNEDFDLILMDIEMPVLDGISATKAIRSAVPGGPIPNPAIPIIGVTAHALKEFRDKSLDAGMDDYVSKPVDFNELSAIINRLVGTRAMISPSRQTSRKTLPTVRDKIVERVGPDSPQTKEEFPVMWSPEQAMEDLGVDEAIFQDFLTTAKTEMTNMAEEIKQAVGSGNKKTSAYLAHTLKSICLSIGAHVAATAAANLEISCRQGSPCKDALKTLSSALDQLLALMKKKA
ncbi:Multi-sensor hybrid histidine kinase [Pseudodesulfovibrio piezophilus C1TLV30]|uniref:Sensory/regulatory protein RpfC n=2 Tax=Pseudodesulfovibrio TaxID=2035811 RepID=M1WTG1_PSEP2|nr:Multi-sensor hybrid histidine kinase [Pseudodesulfovibrio piezophilus C1TLV30]